MDWLNQLEEDAWNVVIDELVCIFGKIVYLPQSIGNSPPFVGSSFVLKTLRVLTFQSKVTCLKVTGERLLRLLLAFHNSDRSECKAAPNTYLKPTPLHSVESSTVNQNTAEPSK